MNRLYYGDNLDVLRRYVGDDSVDLVYLDPPFNSNANYNVLFAEKSGTGAAAQIKAFEDTWKWDESAAAAYHEVVEGGGGVAQALIAFRTFLGENDMLAYLAMMAPRLVELRRVLKPSGSLYLHCDPTASHYLKILLDAIFGPKRFMNEVVWKRSSAHSDTKQGMRRFGKIHDLLLVYTKSDEHVWNPQYTPYTREYLDSEYRHVTDEGKHYKEGDATAAKPGGDTEYDWPVKRPRDGKARWEPDFEEEFKAPKDDWEYKTVRPYDGRFWAYSKENLKEFWEQGKLIHRSTGAPRLMLFADDMPGIALQDLWGDIPPESGDRDLGYPTQKPQALLERILKVSSRPGDVVLDPFCGCGTTIDAAQALGREWIGIDVTHLAIALIKKRLSDAYGETIKASYEVIGEPVTIDDARALAASDPYQFQWWALSLVGARPAEQKKGMDRGIDGRIYFHDGTSGAAKSIILSVKAGHLTPNFVRDLRGTVDREKATIGVLISMGEPTREMRREAASGGFYTSDWGQHPRIQLLTVAEILSGAAIDRPPDRQTGATFKRAPRARTPEARPQALLFGADED